MSSKVETSLATEISETRACPGQAISSRCHTWKAALKRRPATAAVGRIVSMHFTNAPATAG